ncbi:MAG: porphobilinogen synthase [Spirochaetia bacterium]|nr:porphobilinogen synthase [Spirochaetota bacterium]MDW8112748.1 porphobilinogen synthase [Spirochaetia bacterium]
MIRRLRKSKSIRDLVAEAELSPNDFVMPLFVIEGENIVQEIETFPEVRRYSVDRLIEEVKVLRDKEIKSVLLFGVIDEIKKDDIASYSYKEDNVVCKAIREIKNKFDDVVVIADVCVCGYTTHGHCGIWNGDWVDNNKTLEVLSLSALNYARAGVDIVAPSAMMDHQVKAIRKTLDENGFERTLIMSYSAKYSSSFYGPFRDIVGSSPKFSDRKTYQMDYRNIRQALEEVRQDIEEGADIVMVKPALSYLDVIREIRNNFNVPLAAYNVSGEYSMVKVASKNGIFNEKDIAMEILYSIKRAGADIIISYWAKDVPDWL